MKAQIIIDSDLKEWGDYKKMKYDRENNLYYTFKKDKHFLYLSIYKNENAHKFHGGGVQVFFAEKEKDSTGLQLLFANGFRDPLTQKNEKYTHDYFTIKNLKNFPNQKVSTYNETGIMLQWNITDIDYFVIENDVLNSNATPPNPNVFTAEIQIPIAYLQRYISNQKLYFGMALRGPAYQQKNLEMLRSPYQNPKNSFQKEELDRLTPTAFFGSIDVDSILNIN